ncbi:MAG: hypothetical protein ACI3YQ_12050 [Prevotella sp.]
MMICHVTVDFLHYLKILIILALWLIVAQDRGQVTVPQEYSKI